MRRSAGLFFALLAGALMARAQLLTPVSYVATPGQTGLFTYFDDTGAQLTDGILGANDWSVDLGHGNSQEWVGWNTVNPTLTFTFTGSPTVHEVQIGFNRGEVTGTIFLPASVMISGATFALNGDEIADNTRGFLSFDGTWTGNSIQIDLARFGGSYIFVDEVRFSSVASIPEPSAFAAIFGLAAFGAVVSWWCLRGPRKRTDQCV